MLRLSLVVVVVLLSVLSAGCSAQTPTPSAVSPTPATFKALDEQTLADQPPDTQSAFRAAYGARAEETWNAAHNQALIAEMDANATLVATPNPVFTRAWAGSTTVTFSTGSYVVGQVFVSVNGAPEKSFALAQSGTNTADWIWRGSTYEFRLYGGTHREHLLRSLSVGRTNDVVGMLGIIPALVALTLLVSAVAFSRTSRKTPAQVLKIVFGCIATAFVLWVVVTTDPRALDQQPFPDAHEYVDAALHLVAGHGYVTTVHSEQPQPPRYPPGFSVLLAPVAAIGGSTVQNLLGATRWLGAAYVLASLVTAWLLGGPLAAGLVAIVVGTAPFSIESASLLMTDAVITALTVLIAGLLRRPTANRTAVAAVLAGGLGLFRLSALVAIPSLLLAVPRSARRRAFVLVLPGVVGLAAFQWLTFGSPLRTGYDYWLPDLRTFDVSYALQRPMGDGPTLVGDALSGQLWTWLCPCPDEAGPLARLPNILFYPAVVFGMFWIFAPPVIGLCGLASALVRWREPAARYTLWLTLFTCALLTVYVFQAARLAAAPAVLLTIYAAVAVARWVEGDGAPRSQTDRSTPT